jgi:hypothetical protein
MHWNALQMNPDVWLAETGLTRLVVMLFREKTVGASGQVISGPQFRSFLIALRLANAFRLACANLCQKSLIPVSKVQAMPRIIPRAPEHEAL